MSISERSQALETLGIACKMITNASETPAWHETTLQERKAKIASGSAKFIALSELKHSLIFQNKFK